MIERQDIVVAEMVDPATRVCTIADIMRRICKGLGLPPGDAMLTLIAAAALIGFENNTKPDADVQRALTSVVPDAVTFARAISRRPGDSVN